ncbi:helix-turn-helix transcriptional regulator [Pelosinus fermentans]|uniref:WYL domain containing protein n=1 Tax=Pelosinus fermentans JBW45 TaxID=1192197 RepID=I9DM23_9FIRM|nr:YafY family protein [Pelosinus fermentans]AJQ29401.1 WYL domain containing protein [Pelosinus fermentans JBW45]
MKSNRLFEITTILLNKGTITARELAGRFGVSTRTIYRDIDALSSAGIPVYMNKGNGGGIHLLENYILNRAIFSDRESENLLLAVKTLQATQYPELDIALEKMGALFKNASNHDWVEVDFSSWASLPNEENKFNDIKRAMLEQNIIQFDYVNGEGHRSSRLAEPEKLIFKNNAWYLLAFCRRRQKHRTFRISRLKQLDVLAEKFEKKVLPRPIKEEWYSEQPLIALKLRFKAQVINRLYDYFDDSFLIPNDDGSLTLEVEFPEGEWLYSYILSFGSLVEVLEPEYMRNMIAQRIRQALKIYES